MAMTDRQEQSLFMVDDVSVYLVVINVFGR